MLDKERTPESTLTMARNIAFDEGIKFCYMGMSIILKDKPLLPKLHCKVN